MAFDRGQFRDVYVAALGGSIGMFSYPAGTNQTSFFGGEFVVDFGYDDPVAWTTGVNAAEVYGARVYAAGGQVSSSPGAGLFCGQWHIAAAPMFSTNLYVPPAPAGIPNRVYILCTARLVSPFSKANTDWQRLSSVNWTLYRI